MPELGLQPYHAIAGPVGAEPGHRSLVRGRADDGLAVGAHHVAGLLADVLGPALGGYLTENFNWRWVFFINVPIGVVLIPLALRRLDEGLASAEDMDATLRLGLGYPEGPISLKVPAGSQPGKLLKVKLREQFHDHRLPTA